jgi:hypothetical protein
MFLVQMDGNVVSVMANEKQGKDLAICLKDMAEINSAGIPWKGLFMLSLCCCSMFN